MSGKATPDKISEWVEEQSDLSPEDKKELAEDLENYFAQRKKRIEAEKTLGGG